jgi:hypothetical protein
VSVSDEDIMGVGDKFTRRCTICGKKRLTDCSGTPRQISIIKNAHVEGCLKIVKALPNLNSSLTTDELSVCILWTAISLCSGVKKWAVAASRGRYQKAKQETMIVAEPSRINR